MKGAGWSPADAAVLSLAALVPAATVAFPPESLAAGRLVFGLLAALVVILLLVVRPTTLPGRGGWVALLLLPPAAAAVLAAPGRARALDEAALFAGLILFALVGYRAAGDPRAPGLLAAVLAVLGTAAAALALVQAAWIYPAAAATLRAAGTPADRFVDAALVRLEAGRPSGPFILPAALAGFLAMTLPATLFWIRRGLRRGVRPAAATALALQAGALVATRSLGGLAATAVSLAIVLVPRSTRRIVTIAALVVVAAIAAGGFLIERRAEIGSGPGRDPLSLRAGNWGAAAAMLRDHPIAGVGPGGFATAYTQYLRAGMNETRFAHDSWLQLLACWGAWASVPLALLALAWARGLGTVLRAGGATAALAGGGTAFLLHNLVDFTLYLPSVAVSGVVVIGMVLGAAASSSSDAGRCLGTRAPVCRVAVALVVAITLATHAIAAARTGLFLERARLAADAGRLDEALVAARRAAAARPRDPDPRSFIAEVILAYDMDDPVLCREGESAATAAVVLDRRAAMRHATRAAYHAAAGEIAAARLEMERAHTLYPEKPQYRPPEASP